MTVKEIWTYAYESMEIDTTRFQGKTPWNTIAANIYDSVKVKGIESEFVKIPGRPVRFGLKNIDYNDASRAEITPNRFQNKEEVFAERELHKYLTYFVFSRFGAYTKTIDDKKSKKGTKGANEWLHPDMVGIYFPRGDWEENILHLNGLVGGISVKIYSFELKLELNFSNLRETFFQTVSNSFWSNEAYLVAMEIDDSQDFTDELKRLSSLFGIGIIKINIREPQNTEILFNATYKSQLDWETINKLHEINTDFAKFVNHIIFVLRDTAKLMEEANIRPSFDKIYELEDLSKYFK